MAGVPAGRHHRGRAGHHRRSRPVASAQRLRSSGPAGDAAGDGGGLPAHRAACGPSTVVAASGIAFGARLAQERLGVPTATVHLQPSIIRSLVDAGMAGNVRISASQPMWFKRAFFRLADWMMHRPGVEATAQRVSRDARTARRSIACCTGGCIRRSSSSGSFPEWFAALQPDWPPHTHLVGFPLWDTGGLEAFRPRC